MENLFFDDWQSIIRAIASTILGYTAIVIAIRISGNRTLAKMNAFDFVVTIALGSCLAAVALDKKVALFEGVTVFLTLIFLQFAISWLSVRVKAVKTIVSGRPMLLFYKGQMLHEQMKVGRISEEEILVAIRSNGFGYKSEIECVILETTGDLTVIPKSNINSVQPDVLKNVTVHPS